MWLIQRAVDRVFFFKAKPHRASTSGYVLREVSSTERKGCRRHVHLKGGPQRVKEHRCDSKACIFWSKMAANCMSAPREEPQR
eukprot:1161268-Pelagomonas_calceolata.AAC.3